MKTRTKIILTILFFVGIGVFFATDIFSIKGASAAWYSGTGTWGYRKKLSIDYAKVQGPLNNFPMLFNVTDASLKYTGSGGNVASSTGGDIIFTDSTGAVALNYQIEKYSSTTGEIVAWVKVPFVSSTSTTDIYVYYGNASAPNVSASTWQGVWDSNYKCVYHLKDGTTLNTNDSTSNAKNMTAYNGGNGLPAAVSGKIDGAIYTSSSGANYNQTYTTDLSTPCTNVTDNWTIEAWMYPTALNVDQMVLYNGNSTGYAFGIGDGAGRVGSKLTGLFQGVVYINSNYTFGSINTWYHVVMVRNSGTTSFYVNGSVQAGTSASAPVTPTSWTTIGAEGFGTKIFNGYTDEARISNTPRSADWIKTEYNNQNATSTFYASYGSQETPPVARSGSTAGVKLFSTTTVAGVPSWYNTAWGYRKKISFDNQKVPSVQNNFPMLVSVIDPELKSTGNGGKVASTTGGDIIFTNSDGTTALNYEIEKYTSTTGELVAWVKIPFLSSTSTYPIYMYLGNASAPNVSISTWQGVWDSNYVSVYHFGDASTLSLTDSTSNGYTLTNHSATAVSGVISGAASFVPNQYLDNSSFSFPANSNITVEMWNKPNNTSQTGSVFGIGVTDSQRVQAHAPYSANIYWDYGGAGPGRVSGAYTYTSWNMLGLTYNDSISGGTRKIYINGVDTYSASSDNAKPTSTKTGIQIGGWTACCYSETSLDEFRVSKIDRGADWIKTEYNNQSAPSTFYGYGGLEGYGDRQNSSGTVTPVVKVRGGVKFR